MGCWNGTCAISNLPIIAGEKIKMLFLDAPYGFKELNKSAYCYPNGIFHVGAFPIDGEYDDYGSIENVVEDVNYKLIESYFQKKYRKIKVEEKELGKFELTDIIEGIERGSLQVLSKGDVERKEMAMKAMEVYKDNPDSQRHWKELAEMDVSEKWRTPSYNVIMVRDDIWSYIIKNHKTEFWRDEEDRKNPTDYYQTAQEWAEKRFDKYEKRKIKLFSFDNPLSMGGYAGGNHMFMLETYSKVLDKNIEYFKNAFTELTIIESFMDATRKGWMPVSGAGSQASEWEVYTMLNTIVNQICEKNMKESEE